MKVFCRYSSGRLKDGFISHMVQMKGVGVYGVLCVLCVSLYPTWFRWKLCVIFLENISTKSFISHMVQMKGRRIKKV